MVADQPQLAAPSSVRASRKGTRGGLPWRAAPLTPSLVHWAAFLYTASVCATICRAVCRPRTRR
jgi:hypothetical protein